MRNPFTHYVIDYHDDDPLTARIRAGFIAELDATDFANSVAVMLDVRARVSDRSPDSVVLSYDIRTTMGKHHHPALDLCAFTALDRRAVAFALAALGQS